jgi:hypothetical protein
LLAGAGLVVHRVYHRADALFGVGAGVDVEMQRGLDAVVPEDLGNVGEFAGVGVEGLAGELMAQAVGVHSADAEVAQDAAEPVPGRALGHVGGAARAGAQRAVR